VWGVGPSAPVQPVVDAASPGDRIEIHDGGHPGFTVSKALDIVGMGTDPVVDGVSVRGLPAGSVCSVRGLRSTWGIWLLDNRGTVELRRINAGGLGGEGALIADSDRVHAEDCWFRGGSASMFSAGPGMRIDRSTVTLVGTNAFGGTSRGSGSHEAIRMGSSDLLLSGCRVAGAHGSPTYWDPSCPCWMPATAGAGGINGSGGLVLDGGCDVSVGQTGWGTFEGYAYHVQDAVRTEGTALRGLTPATSVTVANQPALEVPEGVAISTALVATVRTEPQAVPVVFADGTTPAPTPLPGFPVPFHLTAEAHVAGVGIADPNGLATLTVGIPNDPRLRFRTLFLQAVAGSVSPHRLGASAPRSAHIEG
jgi:hypothetical protein